MEIGSRDIEVSHFVVGYGDAFGIGVGVEFAVNREAGFRGCRGYEVDNDLIADQGLGAPVLGYERE